MTGESADGHVPSLRASFPPHSLLHVPAPVICWPYRKGSLVATSNAFVRHNCLRAGVGSLDEGEAEFEGVFAGKTTFFVVDWNTAGLSIVDCVVHPI